MNTSRQTGWTARRVKTDKVRLSVGLILTRKFTLGALANFLDVLRLSADEGDRSRQILCEWAILSDDMQGVRSSCGVTVQPTARLGDPGRFHYVGVVGGLLDEIPNIGGPYRKYLQEAVAKQIPLLGICTGALALHSLGLMKGYECCVSWFHHRDFIEAFEGLAPVSDRIFVVDRDRLTCSGGASSAHLAAWLVDRHIGAAQARKSLRIMMFQATQPPETPQPGAPLPVHTRHPLALKALSLMQLNLDTPLRIDELSRRLGVGRRQLERLFRLEFDATPADIFKKIRLGHAEWLLSTSAKSISEIAAETGFADASHFIRTFRAAYSTTPSVYRSCLEDTLLES